MPGCITKIQLPAWLVRVVVRLTVTGLLPPK